MDNNTYKHYKSIAILVGLTMLLSCNNSLKEVQDLGKQTFFPVSIAENINTKYIDSGRMTSNLISSKMLNFTNRAFPFYEFPLGIDLIIYNDQQQKSTVTSEYAIVYEETNIIDLQGNVVLATATNDTLFTEQLFYDRKQGWLFTNNPVKFRTADYITDGNGFDSNKDFTNAQVLEVTGRIFIDE